MIELIYSQEFAPIIPAKTAATANVIIKADEWLPVIDDYGSVIGRSTREYCHSGSRVIHPVVHLHIIDRYGRIFLQKRTNDKFIQPGKWDTAVGGHVAYGESIIEALYRESDEELGLIKYNPVYLETYLYDSKTEREMVFVFAAVGSYEIKLNPEEISDGKYWSEEELLNAKGHGILTPNFESEFERIKTKLYALL